MWCYISVSLYHIKYFITGHIHIQNMVEHWTTCHLMLKAYFERSYVTEDLTTKLHNAMVPPLFDYCDTIYGTTDHLALSKLQRLQNRGAKNVLGVPKDTHTQIVLKDLKWLPLTKRITYYTHMLLFKCLNGLAPNYLSRNCKYVNHCYCTRYQNKQVLYVSKTKLEITKRALAHHGAIKWNTLPDYCK